MTITNDVYLPPESELTVQEVNLSGAALKAGAYHFGKKCEFESNEFMLCKRELQDPRACLNEGKAVTSCALNFFRQVKKFCYDEFQQYATCIDKSSGLFQYEHCRKTQAVYDKCILDNLKIERPPVGYFNQVRIHKSARPPPEPYKPDIIPDAVPKLPDDYPREEAKFGGRDAYGGW